MFVQFAQPASLSGVDVLGIGYSDGHILLELDVEGQSGLLPLFSYTKDTIDIANGILKVALVVCSKGRSFEDKDELVLAISSMYQATQI